MSLKLFHCPSCNHCFTNKDGSRYHNSISRFPVILKCRHTVCETCVKNSLKLQQRVVCSVCQDCTEFKNGDTSKLLPDTYALGVASAANIKQSMPSFKMHLSPNVSNSSLSNGGIHATTKELSVTCDDCSLVKAVFICDTCQENFCSRCFDRFHKSRGRHFKKHIAVPIYAHSYSKDVQKGCEEHDGRAIEFYCEEDNALVCSLCVVKGSHHGHLVSTLVDKNKACAEDLRKIREEALVVQKRLKFTDQKLLQAVPCEKIDNSRSVNEIHDHFHYLHTILIMRENELIKQLDDISAASASFVEKLQEEVSHIYKDLDAVLRDADLVLENPALSISTPAIIKKLESAKDLPCHLVPIQDVDGSKNIDISFDEELQQLLLKYGRITADVKPKYCLKNVSELPEDFIVEPVIVENAMGDDESVASDTFSEDSLSVSPHVNAPNIPVPVTFTFQSLNKEKVSVTHISDPTDFYVVQSSDAHVHAHLFDKINRWCRKTPSTTPTSIQEGKVYLVCYSRDNKWYRGLVKKIENVADSKEENAEIKAKVYYIDFGNQEVVPISRLRHIQKQFLLVPGLAKHCSLHNIVPINQESWSPKAIKEFKDIAQNREVFVQVAEERSGVLYVDVLQTPSNDIVNDAPVSVRDALIFLEHGCFVADVVPTKGRPRKNMRQFLPPETIRNNSKTTVLVSHLDSPSQFYVQQIRTSRFLTDLLLEMKQVYSEDGGILHSVYVPYIGMLCAAQFKRDNFWYRAEVVSLPGGASVEVQYVDFGNREILHYKKLRKLLDQFTKLNIQAIPCSLADVTYLDGKGWSDESSLWLTQYIEKKHLTMLSLGTISGSRVTKTVLLESQNMDEICVNALMVAKNMAHSTGPHSLEVIIAKKPPPLPPPPVKNAEVKKAKVSSPVKQPPQEIVIHESLVPKNVPRNYVEVHMSHIESPGVFYVRIANEIEQNFTRMMDDLQKTYKDSESLPDEVELGSSCACYRTSDQKWYRGIITQVLPGSSYQVRFVDIGWIESVERQNLRSLLDQHKNDQTYAILCHLVGLNPAGDSRKWPQIAVSTFNDLVAPHNVLYLTGEDLAEDGSCPSNLFFKEFSCGGALEPSKIEFVSIRDKLIEKGVALKARKKVPAPAVEVSTVNRTPSPDVSRNQASVPSSPDESPNARPNPKVCLKKNMQRKPTFQWLPFGSLKDTKFHSRATHVGDDGCIYVQTKPEGVAKADVITNALMCKYAQPVSDKVRIPPPIGEAVIAKFALDSKWYRAEIVSDNPDGVKVQFVDFGNYEIVSLDDIRTDVAMKDIPRLAIECELHDTKPARGQTWPPSVMDFVHQSIVEQDCYIEVMTPPEDGKKLQISLMIHGAAMSISLLLKELDFAVSEARYQERLASGDTEVDHLSFEKASDFNFDRPFRVCITHLLEPNVVCVQRLKIDQPLSEMEVANNKEVDEFLKLIQDLNAEADTFHDVLRPEKGMACCARYSYDNQWYRCEITDISSMGVHVYYSDYGNSEVLPIDNVFKVPTQRYLQFPVQVHVCKIHGLQPVDKDWSEECHNALTKKFFGSPLKMYARVIAGLDHVELELLLKTGSEEFELLYKDLIEQGLVLHKDS